MSKNYVLPNHYPGTRPLPMGQFSFNKEDTYMQDIEDEYNILVTNEGCEVHGAPYWLTEAQKEITHSGESPLFTNKLLATGKFQQEHGMISFERALLHSSKPRVMSAPRRRHLNGRKEYYRPNSTHNYLTATDLKNLPENEENIVRYGRPTRTTLLRARQRTNSAPVNAYDIRRENIRRTEDVRNNSLFNVNKEVFEREQTRISYRYLNIYASDGETVHSFLTGARYNRAHLLDSKGMTVYGVYMPRENPTDCFITGTRRPKPVPDTMPVAPPDSPRSDVEGTISPSSISRPTSSKVTLSRPTSSSVAGSTRPSTKHSTRPTSLRRTQSQSQAVRPTRQRSAKKDRSPTSASGRFLPLKPDSPSKKEMALSLPNEVTLEIPEHINKGKTGVYVTLKGQRMVESYDSKLPRVTGVSLPKIRKSRDLEEFMFTNQPPPTPVDVSFADRERQRYEPPASTDAGKSPIPQIAENTDAEEEETPVNVVAADGNQVTESAGDRAENAGNSAGDETTQEVEEKGGNADNVGGEQEEKVLGEVVTVDNTISERTSMEIGPIKKVNFSDQPDVTVEPDSEEAMAEGREETGDDGKVKFFVTEEDGEKTERGLEGSKQKDNELANPNNEESEDAIEQHLEEIKNAQVIGGGDSNSNGDDTVDGVVETAKTVPVAKNVVQRDTTLEGLAKRDVDVSEAKRNKDKGGDETEQEAVTSKDYPFESGD